MGGFTPYEKDNTLCISVLQNHSPIPSSEEDMTCSHASPKYKASTSTTHFLPTLAVRSIPDVTHQENREPGNGERTSKIGKYIGISLITLQTYSIITLIHLPQKNGAARLRRWHRNAERVSSGISTCQPESGKSGIIGNHLFLPIVSLYTPNFISV